MFGESCSDESLEFRFGTPAAPWWMDVPSKRQLRLNPKNLHSRKPRHQDGARELLAEAVPDAHEDLPVEERPRQAAHRAQEIRLGVHGVVLPGVERQPEERPEARPVSVCAWKTTFKLTKPTFWS